MVQDVVAKEPHPSNIAEDMRGDEVCYLEQVGVCLTEQSGFVRLVFGGITPNSPFHGMTFHTFTEVMSHFKQNQCTPEYWLSYVLLLGSDSKILNNCVDERAKQGIKHFEEVKEATNQMLGIPYEPPPVISSQDKFDVILEQFKSAYPQHESKSGFTMMQSTVCVCLQKLCSIF